MSYKGRSCERPLYSANRRHNYMLPGFFELILIDFELDLLCDL